MATSVEYKARAEEFLAMAQRETDTACRQEYERLAQCYIRLAGLADRNSHTDLVYETPPVHRNGNGHSNRDDPLG